MERITAAAQRPAGHLPGEVRRQIIDERPSVAIPTPREAHPAEIIYWIFATLKNVLAIVLMVIVLIIGHRLVVAANDLKQIGNTFVTPAGADRLPVDKCGGGVC